MTTVSIERRRLRRLTGIVSLAAMTVASCSDDDSAAPPDRDDADSATITIVEFSFDPMEVMVAPGASATVTAPVDPGSYPYICSLHPFMKGTLIVR